MRTLWVHTEAKQKEKAIETLEILTPIAHRLGMSKMKSELEDLSLRYLKPDMYKRIEETKENKAQKDRGGKTDHHNCGGMQPLACMIPSEPFSNPCHLRSPFVTYCVVF